MLASEALAITNNNNFKADAVQYGIKSIEDKIRENATRGNRNCIIRFLHHPCVYRDFVSKYGEDHKDDYKLYDVEQEIREYFTNNGFKFRLITDDICGGVRQDPYWTICW